MPAKATHRHGQAAEFHHNIETCRELRNATFPFLRTFFATGAVVKKTPLTKEFGMKELKAHYGDNVLPLFLLTPSKELLIFSKDKPLIPKAGHSLISIIIPKAEKASA